MRLKILFVPFILVLAVILAIWFIWPAFGDLKMQMKDLQAKQESLNNVVAKKNNMQILKNALNQNPDKESFVLSYLPSQKNEEKIINSINFLATSYQLGLINVNISKPKTTTTPNVTVQSLLNNTADAPTGTVLNPKEVQNMVANMSVSGSYEQITKFVDSVNKIEFFNKIDSIEISTQSAAAANPQQKTDSKTLNCDLTVEFGYLMPLSAGTDYAAPIFSQVSFDFNKVNGIIQSISEKAPVLDDGTKGESNPFFP